MEQQKCIPEKEMKTDLDLKEFKNYQSVVPSSKNLACIKDCNNIRGVVTQITTLIKSTINYHLFDTQDV